MKVSLRRDIELVKPLNRSNCMDFKNKTIKDFGEQWLTYRGNEGYYGSLKLFSDIVYEMPKGKEVISKSIKLPDSGDEIKIKIFEITEIH